MSVRKSGLGKPGGGCEIRWAAVALALLAALVMFSCSEEEPARKVDLTRREEIRIAPPAADLTYAYLPQYAHSVSFRRHHLLVQHIARSTGLSVRQVFPATFDEHIQMVSQGLIDISFTNPFVYTRLADQYGARAFARIIEHSGERNFRGQIIRRTDNEEIATLEDCRGKRWIAVDPLSAGGYLFPLGLFLEHGIAPGDFAEIAFAPGPGGKQEKVVLSVLAGNHDIGSIREGTLKVLADQIDLGQIHVLAATPWYPGWVFSARQGLAGSITEAVRKALTSLSTDDPAEADILEQARIMGVIPAEDEDFDAVRRLVDALAGAQALPQMND